MSNSSSLFCQCIAAYGQMLHSQWNEPFEQPGIMHNTSFSSSEGLEIIENESSESAFFEEGIFDDFEECTGLFCQPDPFGTIKIVFLIMFMSFGIPANFLILYVSMRNRRKLPASSYLVINLALCDFLVLLNMPLEIVRSSSIGQTGSFPDYFLQSNFICKYFMGIVQTGLVVSVLIIVVIAFDRFRLISSIQRHTGTFRYLAYSLGVWLVSFALTSPQLYFAEVIDYDKSYALMISKNRLVGDNGTYMGKGCKVKWMCEDQAECANIVYNSTMSLDECPTVRNTKFPMETTYISVFLVVVLIVPITATILLYTGLLNKVNVIRKSISSLGNRSSNSTNPGDVALRRSIKLFSAALVLAWLPWVVVKAIQLFYDERGPKFTQFVRAAAMMTWTSPVLNPILYSLIGRRFRQDLQNSFSCCVDTRQKGGPTGHSTITYSVATERPTTSIYDVGSSNKNDTEKTTMVNLS